MNLPENAISVQDFLKSKPVEETPVTVERPKESENLQFQKKEENEELGVSGPEKKGKKKKEKKGNKGQELIPEFGGFDDGQGRRNYYGGYQKKQKFRYNEEDFPSGK